MSITRWQPRELGLDEWFEDAFRDLPARFFGRQALAMDVYETDKDVVVKMDVPGLKPDDLDIAVRGNMLVVRGETRSEEEVKEEDYFRRERRFGSFRRAVNLPSAVDADKAEASLSDGTLTITLPKKEQVREKSVPVRVAGSGKSASAR